MKITHSSMVAEKSKVTTNRYLVLIVLVWCFIPAYMHAQHATPASPVHAEFSANRMITVTDTITFDGLPTNTEVTDQYATQGAVFMGYNGSGNPFTHDYGTGSFGSVLHSDDWYNPLRMDFVDTADASLPALAKKIEFDNPIDSEVDYVSFKVYDSDDNLIYSYLSTSPEHVVVEFENYIARYVVFDDSLETAYVIDNILFDASYEHVSVEEPTETSFEIYPNPSNGIFNVTATEVIEEVSIFNHQGQKIDEVKPLTLQYRLEIKQSGLYYLVLKTATTTQTRKVSVR